MTKDLITVEQKEDISGDDIRVSGLTPEDLQEQKRLKWKIDLTILPLLALTYFLSSMGRADLANASIAGLSKDLHLTPHQYSNVASFFQIGYILFQIPGTILVRHIGPPLQFGPAMLLWGIFTVCNVFAKSYATLLGLRILVGIAESFIQGAVFYLSFWYTYDELATRGAIFFSTSALAGSFNGLIAYGIEKHLAGMKGWRAWQWLYFIEGVLPIGCSLVVMILLPSTPERGHFLFSKKERDLAIRRSRAIHNPEGAKLRPKLIYKPLTEVRFWLLTLLYATNHYVAGALSNFLPAIIAIRLRILKCTVTVDVSRVYACALVGINAFAMLSDRSNRRGLPLLAASLVAIIGLIMLLTIDHYQGRLAGTCILAFGIFATIPISAVWLTTNIAGYTKRGSAAAMMNMLAQTFSIAGNQAYHDPPLYRKDLASSLGLVCVHVAVIPLMLWMVKRFNNQKESAIQQASPEELSHLRSQDLDVVGDRHIDFRAGY